MGAAILTNLVEKAKARGLTEENVARLATEDGEGLLEKVADLLALEMGSAIRTTFSVAIDYTQSLAAMIKAGHYNWVNSDITEQHFPITPGPKDVSFELVHFDRLMYTDAVLAELEKRGVRPATLPELLAFGAKYPEKQREFSVVALASVWRHWQSSLCAPSLWGRADGRLLLLDWLDRGWGARCRFAAVRK
ncbi:MAG: hypothetical protein HY294_06575 [Candidatus Rokubacteria bacterium]|nr:hypothetical protein [Candidatus Rokubacteria bacterium]